MQLEDVCSVNIYMSDMGEYAALNEIYLNNFSFQNPPTRVCVQCPLPKYVGLILDAVSLCLLCQPIIQPCSLFFKVNKPFDLNYYLSLRPMIGGQNRLFTLKRWCCSSLGVPESKNRNT